MMKRLKYLMIVDFFLNKLHALVYLFYIMIFGIIDMYIINEMEEVAYNGRSGGNLLPTVICFENYNHNIYLW